MRIKKTFKRTECFLAMCVISSGLTPEAMAQDAASGVGEVSEIMVTGSRRSGMAVSDSASPVQLINSEVLKESGSPDLMNAIANQVPSYNAEQRGTDMASQTLTASMRALGTNHALILVNGKRRHVTSNVNPVSGSNAADLSFIPTSAISRLEVLTDGAAAIYGSDAIAGVINIILNDDYEGGSIGTSVSEYVDGGAKNTSINGNIGFGSPEAYLNLSFETEDRETVSRSIAYGPALCVADPVECLNRIENGTESGYSVSSSYRRILERDQGMLQAKGFPALNNQSNPPAVERFATFFNAGYELNRDMNLYAYGNYGEKTPTSFEIYRRPSQDGGFDENGDGDMNDMTAAGVPEWSINKYPNGFVPKLYNEEKDYSLTLGIDGVTGEWRWDATTGYGRNSMDIENIESMNFAIWNETGQSQEDFDIGSFEASQWTTSIDLSRDFDIGMAEPMTFATGLEYRKDTYAISAGEPASYYGAGASAFPGYQPDVNTGDYDRSNVATFANFIFVPTDRWLIDAAIRYEDYSDFGDQTVSKLTARYDVTDTFAVRGTVSTGFRAPTLGEGFYSAVIVAPTSATIQVAANDPAAASLGFGAGLQAETAESVSVGVVFELLPGLTTTLDAYQIEISDRIQRGTFGYSSSQSNDSVTGRNTGSYNSDLPDPADTNDDSIRDETYNEPLGRALVDFGYIGVWNDPLAPGGSLDSAQRASVSVAVFNNSLDTKTSGIDWVSTYTSRFGWGSINWTGAANYNKTEVLGVDAAPASLGGATMYSPVGLRNQETGDPEYRINLSARIVWNDFSLSLRQSIYGPQYTLSGTSAYTDAVIATLDTETVAGNLYYKNQIDVLQMTNVELTWTPTDALRLSAGVDNLFNEYPTKIPDAVWQRGQERYSNTGHPYQSGSPVGFFGARWFGKLAYQF